MHITIMHIVITISAIMHLIMLMIRHMVYGDIGIHT
jgi:hypothetical protein